jgi:hypothetical protein
LPQLRKRGGQNGGKLRRRVSLCISVPKTLSIPILSNAGWQVWGQRRTPMPLLNQCSGSPFSAPAAKHPQRFANGGVPPSLVWRGLSTKPDSNSKPVNERYRDLSTAIQGRGRICARLHFLFASDTIRLIQRGTKRTL